jgi:hypothetical protein
MEKHASGNKTQILKSSIRQGNSLNTGDMIRSEVSYGDRRIRNNGGKVINKEKSKKLRKKTCSSATSSTN